jgi:hypothetical protein
MQESGEPERLLDITKTGSSRCFVLFLGGEELPFEEIDCITECQSVKYGYKICESNRCQNS